MNDSLQIVQLNSELIEKSKMLDSIRFGIENAELKVLLTEQQMDSLNMSNINLHDSIATLNTAINSNVNEDVFLGLPLGLATIVIPTIVTLFVFSVGIFISWWKRKSERKNEVNSYKSIILDWIDLISTPLEKQIAECINFRDALMNSHNMQPEPFSYNSFLTNKIDDISINKFVDTFVINSSGLNKESDDSKYKWCYNLISQFSYLSKMEIHIPELYAQYHDQSVEIMNEWNLNFSSFEELTSNQSKLVNSISDHPEKSFHKKVMILINTWVSELNDGQSNHLNTMEKMVFPLTENVKTELIDNPQNDYAFKLSSSLQKLRITHLKWKKNKDANSQLFNDVGDRVNTTLEALKTNQANFRTLTITNRIFSIR